MVQAFRLPDGGKIDRSTPINFTFNGEKYQGYAGDTLASALLANGIHFVGRGFKYHRPRGITTSGHEEPNAIVDLNVASGEEAYREANVRAPVIELCEGMTAESVNAFPSLKYDIGSLNQWLARFFPAGFYYKTFMGPMAVFWTKLYEPVIRKAAGLGRSATETDTARYEFQYGHCDVLIAGGGPAGLSAALAAASGDARVILVDDGRELGGSLLSDPAIINGTDSESWIAEVLGKLEKNPNVRIMKRSSVVSWWDHNFLNVWERCTDHLPAAAAKNQTRQKLHRIRANQVILAQGAFERPLLFNNNDRPGTMLANAARTYVTRYGVRLGKAGIFYTNNDTAYADALAIVEAGQKLVAVIDLREVAEGPNTEAFKATGVPIYANSVIADVDGKQRVRGALISALSSDGASLNDHGQLIECDFIAMAGGWSPNVQLHSQSAAKVKWDDVLGAFVPGKASTVNPSISVGACNGDYHLGTLLEDAFSKGLVAAKSANKPGRARKSPKADGRETGPHRWLWLPPGKKPYNKGGKFFVDYQNDVKIDDLELAQRESFVSVEHTKRYTTLGMATDQGKTSNINALGALSQITGKEVAEIGTTTFRPPYVPTTFMAYVGREVDEFFDVTRTTPMHSWHVDAGAAFEPVGQWDRAWYYPKAGESMHAAVQREAKAVRSQVGVLDASTLGKISVVGPDAGEFLNRIYTNAWKKLPVGKCRYGLMLNEAGMVVDDGVTSRISENEYHMTTTTGGAAGVMGTMEEYLQTEWPELQVYLTSVTEQWAVAALNGPNSRKVLEALTDDDISAEALPFMSWREINLSGIPARIFRISFTGDLAFEVNVSADYGLQLWNLLMTAGQPYGLTPYGTETMHLLRAEKGFIIVGQETDGSMTPMDLGLGGMVSTKKGDFIGRRSLSRPDIIKDDRKQLVGLDTTNPETVLPEGAQLVFGEDMPDQDKLPAYRPAKEVVRMAGFVSSSYYSPNCNQSIAMALVKGGHNRIGEKVFSPQADGTIIEAVIRDTNFYDNEGVRQHG